jgi:hypothetical protein
MQISNRRLGQNGSKHGSTIDACEARSRRLRPAIGIGAGTGEGRCDRIERFADLVKKLSKWFTMASSME